jgi:VanZ family protein
MRRYLYYLPVVAWMSVIFFASTDAGAPEHTSRFLVPILRWLFPGISPEALDIAQTGVRKTAHLTEYCMLGWLLWASHKWATRGFQRWSWGEFRIIIAICALYASSDEFHQHFVGGRHGSPIDVLIDTTGATIGLLLIWRIGRHFNAWKSSSPVQPT